MIVAKLNTDGHKPVLDKNHHTYHYLSSHNESRAVCGLDGAFLDLDNVPVLPNGIMAHFHTCRKCLNTLTTYITVYGAKACKVEDFYNDLEAVEWQRSGGLMGPIVEAANEAR